MDETCLMPRVWSKTCLDPYFIGIPKMVHFKSYPYHSRRTAGVFPVN